ncbi:hypothetical protein Poli38472_009002 [Pythium oligandrum]|uniref:PIPK domain-containing protein n=1 Tax=Pythium oligandrum TaxID=41045 RepID=A0A8K1CLG9_PYTOL|nr:hypothetical protein Poli38472_009002 [Pythium oligandrum]|eukprot:TMW64835.1 hypothetical protein Poli38472_009002 [Pythium oligandrum]
MDPQAFSLSVEAPDGRRQTQSTRDRTAHRYSLVQPPPQHQKRRPSLVKTVIIVVNVLPLVFERKADDSGWKIEWSSSATSLFYRNLVSNTERYLPMFIGCPEVFVSREEETAVEKQLSAFNCVPVFLDPVVAHRYFQGFCKGVLWPVFHNIVDVYNSAKLALDDFEEQDKPARGPSSAHDKASWCHPASWNPAAQDKCWSDYCNVNRTFARRIIERYHEGNMIWIHDFHFLMLPSYLLRKLRTAMIAVYLHVPFPSSEIFRCLAMRTEILRAMLCADHIGFLIFEHARHFLTSCKRLLGLNYKTSPSGMLVVEYNGRLVNISCSHIEPDISYLHSIMDRNDRAEDTQRFRESIEQHIYDAQKQRKFVITSVDRLEGINGLPLKLRAFDRFLSSQPAKRGSVILVQIGLSLDSRPNDYRQTREYVQKFVAEINRRWAPPGELVVHFQEKVKTTCAERMELWRMSDVFLDTSIRSGLSLLPFEFLVAQKRNAEQSKADALHQFGSMVVSEFTSYSRILHGSVLVNPWKADDIVAALLKVTNMQYYEKLNRFQVNYLFLELHPESRWSDRLLTDFEILAERNQQNAESGKSVEVGFGFEYRVMQFASGFVKLDIDELVKIQSKCERRLFIFDYGGTLSWTTSILTEDGASHHSLHRRGSSSSLCPTEAIIVPIEIAQDAIRFIDGQVRTPLSAEAQENLRTLCADPHNVVFVVSTGRKAELDAEFGHIPNMNIVADNGFFLKKAGDTQWECLYDQHDLVMDWKEEVKRMMQAYATRTNGAFVIVSEASVLYDYRNSDPEYGEIQALELYDQLRQVLKKGDATVHRAKGYVEVHQFGVSKSIAVSLILNHLQERVGIPDFAFYAGDDDSDELAFRALQAFADQNHEMKYLYTCTVGMKPSSAKFYVDGVGDVLATIHAIAVRLRLELNRHGVSIFSRQGYFDRFITLGRLAETEVKRRTFAAARWSSLCVSWAREDLMGRSVHSSPPRVLEGRPRERESLLPDRDQYATFSSISLVSEHRGSKSALEDVTRLQEQYVRAAQAFPPKLRRGRRPNLDELESERSGVSSHSCWCALRDSVVTPLRRLRGFIVPCIALFGFGLAGIVWAIVTTADADFYLFLGAIVSLVFSLIVLICYVKSRRVRAHPNPLIFSKSLVDFLLAELYIFEYCVTEFTSPPVVLPFRIAALTQALLVCGEFWFFAMPIDMVQSITNPFTSYPYNLRVYWFYSMLSGLVCGIALWVFDDDPSRECASNGGCSEEEKENQLRRFYWFHENTDAETFWWHRLVSYHVWVLVYLIFATMSIIYVKQRLERGLEETFDVRRRVLSGGLLTCWIYVTWSLLILCLFAVTNLPVVKTTLSDGLFEDLVNLGAFLHSARGCLNIIVWLVINQSNLNGLCFQTEMPSSRTSSSVSGSSSTPGTPSSSRLSSIFRHAADSATSSATDAAAREEQELLIKPDLNVALRRQMIQMATTGIVEAVQQYHRLKQHVESNQTFHLDWQRSPNCELLPLGSTTPLNRGAVARNSTIQVVEAHDKTSGTRFSFLPMAMEEMQFYDFQPKLFASIRRLYGLDDTEYMFAFRHTANERLSEGRSGAFVFTTCDRKYLVKSMTAAEKDVLLELLPSYFRYLKWNPKTLLPRFFGLHAMKMYGQIFYFIVMGNVLNTKEVIHRRYDIKGSWVDRNAPACVLGEKYRCSKCNRFFTFGATGSAAVPCDPDGAEHYPDITLRDNDLKKRLKLDPQMAGRLVKQLTRDSNFLASLGIMDYSLLVGTHYSYFTITSASTITKNESSDAIGPRRVGSMQMPPSLSISTAQANASASLNQDEFLHILCDDGGEPKAAVDASASQRETETSEVTASGLSDTTRAQHRYRAHQVSGPSTYYFGLVDILQKWTIAKRVERSYKVYVLRKSPRGVSAIAPKAYAARFQQKMRQLFITSPMHKRTSMDLLDDGVVELLPVVD